MARCLAVFCVGTLYIQHFPGLLPPAGIWRRAKFTLRPSLVFSCIGSVTARQSSSGRQPNFAAWYKEWIYETFANGTTYIRLGLPSRWASAHILVYTETNLVNLNAYLFFHNVQSTCRLQQMRTKNCCNCVGAYSYKKSPQLSMAPLIDKDRCPCTYYPLDV